MKAGGRFAVIRTTIRLYLETRKRVRIDREIRRAYEGHADEMLDEVAALLDR